jgi:N-acetylneuraminate synthase/N,N'-diacetyllegionaminate synthase
MKKIFKIGNKKISENTPAFIIAEAGVNHNGKLENAYKLIDSATKCGADAIKFQSFLTEECTHKNLQKAKYQKENTTILENQYDMLKKLELNFNDHLQIKEYCKKKKIIFFSTPSDISSLNILKKIKVPCIKISSVDINNINLITKSCALNVPVLISTGMSDLKKINEALKIIKKSKNKKIIFMHCISSYPTKIKDINLRAINFLKKKTNSLIGFSDHTTEIFTPALARVLGACVIEKHFTLNKKQKGPDHSISLNPAEFKQMVKQIRLAEKSLGKYTKVINECEKDTLKATQKSYVAHYKILKGERLKLNQLNYISTGKGIVYSDIKKYIGKKLKKTIKKDQVISPFHFQ